MPKKSDVNAGNLYQYLSKRIEEVYELPDEHVVGVIEKLKEDEVLWNSISSGNRDYLQETVDSYKRDPRKAHKRVRGAVPHLVKALPFQLGFVASKYSHEYQHGKTPSEETLYQKIFESERGIEILSGEELFQLAQEIEGNEQLRDLKAYQMSRKSVGLMLDKYTRLQKKPEEAKRYAEEKRRSLMNIFGKMYIPNLLGKVADEVAKEVAEKYEAERK